MLAEVGLIARESRRNNSLDHDNEIDVSEIEDPDLIRALAFVEGNDYEDPALVSAAWSTSFEERQKLLKSNVSTSDYMNRYPCLRHPMGYQLVIII